MKSNGVSGLRIEEILKQDDTEIEAVNCPEWGGTVYVRTISANARDEWELAFQGSGNKVGMRAALLGTAICDEQGNFLKPSEAEVKALGRKASGPLDRCVDAIMRVNKMREDDMRKLEKNSEKTVAPSSG